MLDVADEIDEDTRSNSNLFSFPFSVSLSWPCHNIGPATRGTSSFPP